MKGKALDMPSPGPDIILKSLGRVLEKEGFVRKKKSWFFRADDTVLLTNVQKSDFGQQYYINLGILIRQLSGDTFPKIQDCHIMDRLEMLVQRRTKRGKALAATTSRMKDHRSPIALCRSDPLIQEALRGRQDIFKALDFEDSSLSAVTRGQVIENAMITVGLPFLRDCETVTKICSCLSNDRLRGVGVWKEVYSLCGLKEP